MADIKLKKLLEILQGAYDKYEGETCQEHINVEFWFGEEYLELDRIGQFGIKPDVTINLKKNCTFF